jgi:hypothetical protein
MVVQMTAKMLTVKTVEFALMGDAIARKASQASVVK